MGTFKIHFKTDNAAFEDNPNESARILRQLADLLDVNGGALGEFPFPVRDINGTTIGQMSYEDDYVSPLSPNAEGSVAEHGFDHTAIDVSSWLNLRNLLFLKDAVHVKDRYFRWIGPGIEIRTGNNPVTGKYREEGRREDDKGFASYIGIYGDRDKVALAVKFIRAHGEFEEDTEHSGFI